MGHFMDNLNSMVYVTLYWQSKQYGISDTVLTILTVWYMWHLIDNLNSMV